MVKCHHIEEKTKTRDERETKGRRRGVSWVSFGYRCVSRFSERTLSRITTTLTPACLGFQSSLLVDSS